MFIDFVNPSSRAFKLDALTILRTWIQESPEKIRDLAMIISDIEMPNMDGYTMTTEIRKEPALDTVYIMLHSSLSGS